LLFALGHEDEAVTWACQFGRGEEGGCGKQHISMFANEDSVLLPQDVRDALKYMMQVVHAMGIADTIPELDYVDGSQEIAGQVTRALVA
jgi:predicted solute-binding protein